MSSQMPPSLSLSTSAVTEKAVENVLGEAFNYESAFNPSSAFCKKILIRSAKEYATENILFLLVCSKYFAQPSRDLFNKIYTEFVQIPTAPRQINITNPETQELKIVFQNGLVNPTIPPQNVFAKSEKTVKDMFKQDTIGRLKKAPNAGAFVLDNSQRAILEKAMECLKSYGITVM